ncbi:hypothetical protein HWV62_15419 [Athelia sp. TMB]|nr:hypothetical protein HWV62_15419 [Athelia sp. TMB]
MSKQTMMIWKAVLSASEAPECPSIYSGPQWADLLFGDPFCQHFCSLIPASKFRARFPGVDIFIMDLIPHTIVGTSGSKCYWREDIVAMSKQFADYRKAVAMGKSGAKKALDDFTTSRLVLAAQTTVAARNCKEWLVTRAEAAKVAKHQLREKRYHDIRQRLLALGHDEKDMHRLHTLPVVDKNSELTERSWNTMRKAIEGHVNHVRATRIQRERLPLLRSRMDVIKSVYNDYKATAVPATWSYQPADEVAQRLPCFAALIDDPSDLPLDVQRCREALKYLPSDVDALNEEKTAVLLSLLVRSSERTAASVADDAGSALDLATTIFICQGRYCGGGSEPFIGWQHAICHRCQIGPFQSAEEVRIPEFRFALQASKAVCSLASLLGLDAGVVTPQDLDRADGRLVPLQTVTQHLEREHGCTSPVEGQDFFYDKRYSPILKLAPTVYFPSPLPSREVMIVGTSGTGKLAQGKYRCKHCPSCKPKPIRLFKREGIISHIQAK